MFLFVGKFEERKGIDLLLRAYLQSFTVEDNVLLVILTSPYHSDDPVLQLEKVLKEKHIVKTVLSPRYLLLQDVKQIAMPALYSFADVLVIPSHGEGWGRPHIEAMSCGTPVIATNWSGPTAFISDDNGYLLSIEEELVPAPGWQGHQWAQPNISHLKLLMRSVDELHK